MPRGDRPVSDRNINPAVRRGERKERMAILELLRASEGFWGLRLRWALPPRPTNAPPSTDRRDQAGKRPSDCPAPLPVLCTPHPPRRDIAEP